MKVIDCYWEEANIGSSTVEVEIEKDDVFNEETFSEFVCSFDYVVVKVPMKMTTFNFGLAKLGYTMTEIQCKLSKDYADFNFDDGLVKRIMPHVSFQKIEDNSSLRTLIEQITPGMFSTDRISLDPHYGLEKACGRYKNWISSYFEEGKAEFLSLKYDNKDVGFSMYRKDGATVEMILGGIFEGYQSRGIGILTPTRHLLYAKQTGETIKKVSTTISSNNVSVWRIYNHFNFKVDSLYYVYIMHNTTHNRVDI